MSQPLLNERQKRTLAIADLELRVSAEDEAPRIVGYAAMFNQPSEIISDIAGVYREFIAPGAFAASLSKGADVRALVNHNPDYVLGRTKSGTLTLKEDSKGLWYEVDPPDTGWARDLLTTMRRGDIDQSSFAFRIVKDEWSKGRTADGKPIDERTILEAQLFDVSPVTYPAYRQTSSAVRALLDAPDPEALLRLLLERYSALPVPGPAPSGHPGAGDPAPAPSGHAVLRRNGPVHIDAMRGQRLRERLERVARL